MALVMVASSVGLMGLAVGVSSAAPAVACGAVLTANTTLTQDLVCSSGDGLTLAANGITVDLKGHTITGLDGTVAAIRIPGGVTGVTVQNGSLAGFADGVVADTANSNHITKLRISVTDQGILLANAANTLVDKNTITARYRDGIKVDGNNNTIAQNTVTNSAFGISVSANATGNTVTQNVLTGNRDFGVAAFDNASGTTILRNTVSGSVDGIKVDPNTSGTLVKQNTSFSNSNDGIKVTSASTTITQNTTYGNGGAGIEAVPGVTDGGGNNAYGNGSPCVNIACSTS
ncbi:MAG: right-handed parallel beta-helix repeat-containing protein [Actinomycetes bacterium]